MVQCEMCGAETSSPKKVKVEGAELDVCGDCSDFGTEVKQQSSSGETSTKYSTGSSGGSSTSSSASGGTSTTSSTASSGGGSRSRSDMFDDMDELAQDYDERIRRAREDEGLSQADLANELNEKASLIRKLERGDTLPSDDVQAELEGYLDIDLSGSGGEDTEWEGGSASGEYTLGDVVKRKD